MCGIAGIFGIGCTQEKLAAMVDVQLHRGPDAEGIHINRNRIAGLGHSRLSIIDLSAAGWQPMKDVTERFWIVFNGEIYNYLELRSELSDYPYQSKTDTEVVLAAYERWGEKCLDKFIGMFAFLIWDEREQKLFAARDRFGVKPLYYYQQGNGTLFAASEIKALFAAGIQVVPDAAIWSTYLSHGLHDHSENTFLHGVKQLLPGHTLTWQDGQIKISRWYDIVERVGPELDKRPVEVVEEEYLSLLEESVKLRFRSDVPVGVNLSGGLDSSTLLGLVHKVQGEDSDVKVFTFTTGDENYDELPWVLQMLERTKHPFTECRLLPEEVPSLADSVQVSQDEPFGGLPTLAYTKLFRQAREQGIIVLLDGQGMDEQWAGYDYYTSALNGSDETKTLIQGTKSKTTRPECLTPEFRALSQTFIMPLPFKDRIRNLQYRDTRYTRLPKVLRFNDRASMHSSTELREPFLDHRLFELAFRQPHERKIQNGTRKFLLREMIKHLIPKGVVEAPKRPLQTPQREWLRGKLRDWANDLIELALIEYGGIWLDENSVLTEWKNYCDGHSDNSFYVWQWVNLGLATQNNRARLPQKNIYDGDSLAIASAKVA
jgi:asparagine synthase (glutamine-hydrolysing)